MARRRERIAILGGGMASLSAAFALTRRPNWHERYEITVYQMGHRLGGKGASGRNRELSDRIEEHGIHVFFGFYDNAFGLLRECYEELDRPPEAPLARLTDAFDPQTRIAFTETQGGSWSVWSWDFPPNDAVLGEGGPVPTPWGHVKSLIARMGEWYEQVAAGAPAEVRPVLSAPTPELARAQRPTAEIELAPKLVERLWRGSQRSALGVVRELIATLGRSAAKIAGEPDRCRDDHRAALRQVVRHARVVRESARWLARWLDGVPALRRALTLLDFSTTTIIGLVEDELVFPPEDWRRIDGIDFRQWLIEHGAARSTADCALLRGMYAGIFSTEHEVGAGTMLHYTLRMLFTYRGAIYYKMQAGMGDVVFAPLYLVLRRRGVRFEFFHRVDRLELDAAGRRIERVHVGRQVKLRRRVYEPLYEVSGLPSWPSEPLYEQLVSGERLRRSGESLEDAWTGWRDELEPRILEAGRDFDRVVLGISLGALPTIARELVEDPRNDRFGRMIATLRTTQTQAMQLWLRPDAHGLGWNQGPSIVIPYEEPFDTWTDMAHLIACESWMPGEVGSIAYLCSPMPDVEPVAPPGDSGYAHRQRRRVEKNAHAWLERHAGWLWPGARDGHGFAWSILVDPQERTGAARLGAQHFAAPQNPSDRYNLSLPGTSAARLAAGGSGYENLVLAGDWTFNTINAGCIEAATTSGLLAARAICGEPRSIPGDWTSALEKGEEASARVPALPRYVGRDVNDCPAPPFVAQRTRMVVFPLDARRACLEGLCDRFLHLGGPMRYRPIVPLIFFYCQDNARLEAAEPRAGMRELDFGFLVPLLALEPGRPPRVVAFIPYLWVDTELACRAGRELYGFPKAMGTLQMGEGNGAVYSVDGLVAEPAGGLGGSWVTRRLVEARPLARPWTGLTSGSRREAGPLETLAALLSAAGGVSSTWRLAREATGNVRAGVVPMVFLKQFRDVEDPTRACYQAIVESEARRLGGFRGRGRLRQAYEVAVCDLPGLPLAERLGMVAERRGGLAVARARAPFWLEFDFALDAGRVVWSATDPYRSDLYRSGYSTPAAAAELRAMTDAPAGRWRTAGPSAPAPPVRTA